MVLNWISKARGGAAGAERKGATPQPPAGMRLYAVGDIHGHVDQLDRLHDLILEDAARGQPLVKAIVYVGDYVDRGLQSKQVIDRLLSQPLPDFRTYYLKGNHEEALLDFLDDPAVGPSWSNFGGLETLHSYGVDIRPPLYDEMRAQFQAKLPETHRAFYRSLKLSVTLGDYHFVHAGVRPGVTLERQVPADLLWIREAFLESDTNHGKVIVHGHTPKAEPENRHNRIGIDTGVYMTGVLTAVVLDRGDRRFLQTTP